MICRTGEKTMLFVKFKKLDERAVIPRYQSSRASGFDFHCIEDVVIPPGVTMLVKLGLSVELPPDTEMQIRPRSGLALKTPYMVKNSPGTVDEDYRGELGVIVHNCDDCLTPLEFKTGDRIAQGVICPVLRPVIIDSEELSATRRGTGGRQLRHDRLHL
jgi:dUTP pyrophosphatase